MSKCIFCGNPTALLFSARDYARPEDFTEYRVNWCKSCDFGRVEGSFTEGDIGAFYKTDYYTHHNSSGALPKLPFFERLRAHLGWRADYGTPFDISELSAKARSVCDIGCGNGFILRQFKDAGFRTVGIDPDPLARTAAANSGDIYEGSAERPPGLNEQFGLVLLSHVLEHCIDPAKAVRNARDLLSPDGALVIEVPNNAALGFSDFGAAWPWSDIPRHLSFFTNRSLTKLIEDACMVVTERHYVGFARQIHPSWAEKQTLIWKSISNEPAPNFNRAAWLLLAKTAFASSDRKYDSIRVHARLG